VRIPKSSLSVGLVIGLALVGACSGSGGQGNESARGGAIEGKTWHVTAYVDAGGELQDAFVTVPLDARFESGTISGAAGCGSFTARYTLSGGSLAIDGLEVPAFECDSYANQGRELYMAALRQADGYAVDGSRLIIYNDLGRAVLRFEERP
jgi:hypothetical protein